MPKPLTPLIRGLRLLRKADSKARALPLSTGYLIVGAMQGVKVRCSGVGKKVAKKLVKLGWRKREDGWGFYL